MNDLYSDPLYRKATETPLDTPTLNYEKDFQYTKETFFNMKYNGNAKPAATSEIIIKFLLKYFKFAAIRDDKNEELWVYKNGIYEPNGKCHIEEICGLILESQYEMRFINLVFNKIKARNYIEMDLFFNKQKEYPHLLPVQNGILNIYTLELQPFNSDFYFFTKLPMNYKKSAKCPHIKKFVETILSNELDFLTVQEIFGFCLLKDYKFEKGFMLYGEHGRNGKSKLLSLLELFVTPQNSSAISLEDIEKDQFSIVSLQNKLVNIASDISNAAINHVGNYKKIVGRDPISANRKNRSRVQFVNYAKMIFAANELPPVYTLSNSFWLRWVVIEFPFQFLPQNELDYLSESEKENSFLQDPDIIPHLKQANEMEGLLNWALDGLTRLNINKRFSNELSASHVQKYWLRKSNSVAAFIEDCIMSDYDNEMTKQDFKKHYHVYCKKHNIQQRSDKVIKITLSNTLGITDRQHTHTGLRVWSGVRLKDGVEQQQDEILRFMRENKKTIDVNDFQNTFRNFNEYKDILKRLETEGTIYELPAGTWTLT